MGVVAQILMTVRFTLPIRCGGDRAAGVGYDAVMPDLDPFLEELDQLLMELGDDWMLLPQLDGYLTGVIVSPDLVPPNAWLRPIWAGDDGAGTPEFADMGAFQHVLDLIMRHYNGILSALDQPGSFEPVFDIDTRNGDILWELWVEGFVEAMSLAPDGWRRLAASDDPECKAAMKGISKLIAIADGKSRLSRSKAAEWTREAPDLIPIWVEILHAWRLENDPNRPASPQHGKVGRNDPCPCGSGKKYKKCCGLN